MLYISQILIDIDHLVAIYSSWFEVCICMFAGTVSFELEIVAFWVAR